MAGCPPALVPYIVDEAEGLTLRFGFSAGVGARLGLLGGMNEMPGALGLSSVRFSIEQEVCQMNGLLVLAKTLQSSNGECLGCWVQHDDRWMRTFGIEVTMRFVSWVLISVLDFDSADLVALDFRVLNLVDNGRWWKR